MTKQIWNEAIESSVSDYLARKELCTEAISIMYHDETSLDANARM